MYVGDNNQTYPLIRGWAAAGGQQGNYVLNPTVAASFGVALDYGKRPLNEFVPAVLTWRLLPKRIGTHALHRPSVCR